MSRPYTCPACGSRRTQSIAKITAIVGLGLFVFGGAFAWLIFPLFFALVGVVMMVSAPFTRKRQCEECKHKFVPAL